MLGDTAIREAGLEDLAAAVAAGRRLGDDQVARLWRCPHLHAVRELGDRMRRRLHPERPAAPAPGVTPLGVEPASPEALCALRDRGLCAVVLCDPDRRRTALEMLHALACAREAGYEACGTDWRATNLLASRFWPRRGFRPTFLRLYRHLP